MENQVSLGDIAVDDVVSSSESLTAEASVPPKKKKRHVNQQKLQDNLWGWIFCIPLIVGTVWFVYAALVMAVMLSFTDYELGSNTTIWQVLGNLKEYWAHTPEVLDEATGEWSGGDVNAFAWYIQIFTKSITSTSSSTAKMNEMGMYLFNTVFYMIGIPIGMVLSMFLAVCMSRDIKGGNVFRVLYYVPCVASTISIVFTFKIMFNENGVINTLLGTDNVKWLPQLGASTWNSFRVKAGKAPIETTFMQDPYWCQGILSKLIIVIMSVWKGLGGTIILYIAGLSGVNAATKEAAQIDGANAWKIFWKVTMPDLYPVIFYNVVTSVIGGLQIYMEPELLAGSSENTNALTSGYVALVFRYGLQGDHAKPGAGAAYGLFLGLIILILTLFQFWLDGRKEK